MKKLLILPLICALLAPAGLFAADFEGTVTMKISGSSPAGGGAATSMNFSLKGGLTRLDMDAQGMSVGVIMDPAKQQMTMLMTQQRMYMVRPIPMANPPADAATGKSAVPALENTGTTATILGYECVKYLVKDDKGRTTELWLTDRIGAFGGFGGAGAARPVEEETGGDITYPVTISFEQAVRGTTVEVRLNSPDRSIDETISVKVPPGVDEGSKVRARGKGQPGPGGRGDLIILTHGQAHPYYRREGQNIELDLPISAAEAANGTTVSVPTLEGKVDLRVPAGIGGGKRLRIKGRGVPQRDGTRGDQFVRILIQVPPDLTADEKAQLTAMDKAHRFDPRRELPW